MLIGCKFDRVAPYRRRTRRPDRVLYRSRTHLDFQVVYRRAGDGHHERGGIAEVALKLDRRRAARQLWTKRLELQIDVAELLPGFSTFSESWT